MLESFATWIKHSKVENPNADPLGRHRAFSLVSSPMSSTRIGPGSSVEAPQYEEIYNIACYMYVP